MHRDSQFIAIPGRFGPENVSKCPGLYPQSSNGRTFERVAACAFPGGTPESMPWPTFTTVSQPRTYCRPCPYAHAYCPLPMPPPMRRGGVAELSCTQHPNQRCPFRTQGGLGYEHWYGSGWAGVQLDIHSSNPTVPRKIQMVRWTWSTPKTSPHRTAPHLIKSDGPERAPTTGASQYGVPPGDGAIRMRQRYHCHTKVPRLKPRLGQVASLSAGALSGPLGVFRPDVLPSDA